MKNGKFETQAEIYQALLDKKKIRQSAWPPHEFIHLKNGNIVFQNDGEFSPSFSSINNWELYQQPKQKVKIVAHMHEDGSIYYSEENSRVCVFRSCSNIFKRLSLSFDAEVL